MLQHETGVMPQFDERREIFRLLSKLPSGRRIDWLKWCCEQVSAPSAKTTVTKSDGSTNEVYWDAMSLFWGSHLSMERAGTKLVEMVRGRV